MQKIYKVSALLLSLLLVSCNGGSNPTTESPTETPTEPEIEIQNNIESSINYQIFVRSFADSNGDGIGDLNGIKNKIPYLKKIGVKSIWLTPIHKTSSDHGYDVIDYYSIAKDLGTMEDFEALVAELKENNMNIIMDMVFNHASCNTSYFQEAYEDFDAEMMGEIISDSKSSWFNFSLEPQLNYIKYKDYYVESSFSTASMCDLNLLNPDVINECGNILNFWADKGVSGYRFDAVKYFVGTAVREETITVLNQLKAFQPDLYYVGEAWDEDPYYFNRYYESDFDAFFNFPMCAQTIQSGNIFSNTVNGSISKFYSAVLSSQNAVKKYNNSAVPAYFLTNHDMDRVSSLTEKSEVLKLAASTTYLLPGTPFIYYGEEIGMKGVRIAEDTDADRRMPMLFEEGVKCKELRGTKFKDQITEDVDFQLNDRNSVLSHYMRVTSLRNKMGSMVRNATFKKYNSAWDFDYGKLFAYKLVGEGKSYSIFTNLDPYNSYSVELKDTYKSVIGYVNAKDYTVQYTLAGQNLNLPSYGTIILED